MASAHRLKDKWRIRWFDEYGVRRSAVFADKSEADFQLKRHLVTVEEIRRGLRRARPVKRRFSTLCDYWLENRACHKRSRRDDESIIRCHLRPSFGHLLLKDVGTVTVDRFKASRRHLANKTVANHLTLLSSMLNVAVDLGWLINAPRIRKPKVRLFSRQYRYLKTDEEVTRLLRAAKLDGDDAFVLYCAAVYTGMRQGELAALRWSDIDFKRRLIVVERSFNGPTKADDVRYVPILDVLLGPLLAWRRVNPEPLVFPNRSGQMHQPGARVFKQRFHRILDEAGFARPSQTSRWVHYINFHSFRHTFASHWMMKGGDLFKLQKILGHKSVEMTQRYAHLAPDAYASDHGRFRLLSVC